jgi:hypothetical protein
MIVQLTWTNMKTTIDANPATNFFYNTEDEYKSNGPETNKTRYYVRQVIGNDENYCLICQDGGADDVDFTNNYKTLPRAIETL